MIRWIKERRSKKKKTIPETEKLEFDDVSDELQAVYQNLGLDPCGLNKSACGMFDTVAYAVVPLAWTGIENSSSSEQSTESNLPETKRPKTSPSSPDKCNVCAELRGTILSNHNHFTCSKSNVPAQQRRTVPRLGTAISASVIRSRSFSDKYSNDISHSVKMPKPSSSYRVSTGNTPYINLPVAKEVQYYNVAAKSRKSEPVGSPYLTLPEQNITKRRSRNSSGKKQNKKDKDRADDKYTRTDESTGIKCEIRHVLGERIAADGHETYMKHPPGGAQGEINYKIECTTLVKGRRFSSGCVNQVRVDIPVPTSTGKRIRKYKENKRHKLYNTTNNQSSDLSPRQPVPSTPSGSRRANNWSFSPDMSTNAVVSNVMNKHCRQYITFV